MLFDRLKGSGSYRPGDRGIVAGFSPSSIYHAFTIGTTTNASNWGNSNPGFGGGTNNGAINRAIFTTSYTDSTSLYYLDMSSSSSAVYFGSSTQAGGMARGASNGSSDRGIIVSSSNNNVYYVTISTTGNATNYATFTSATYQAIVTNGQNDRAIIGTSNNNMYSFNISSGGAASSFGTSALIIGQGGSGCSNDTNDRGIWGSNNYNTGLQTIATISTNCNATVFGSDAGLDASAMEVCIVSNGVGDNAILAGGWGGVGVPTGSSRLRYVNFASLGNSTYVGDAVESFKTYGGCSNGYA